MAMEEVREEEEVLGLEEVKGMIATFTLPAAREAVTRKQVMVVAAFSVGDGGDGGVGGDGGD